jgi:hypothetical protein
VDTRRICKDRVSRALRCSGCGADLADSEVVGEVRRQVLEIPEIRVRAVDHIAERRQCACRQDTVATFPNRSGGGVLGAGGCEPWPST